jgi:carnitine O-acetyltransferase
LRLNLREGESHDLLEDPLYAKSQDYKLSTSGLSSGDRFFGTGFGAPDPDGYGINCQYEAFKQVAPQGD